MSLNNYTVRQIGAYPASKDDLMQEVGVGFMPTRWADFNTFSGGNKFRPYGKIRKSMRNNS